MVCEWIFVSHPPRPSRRSGVSHGVLLPSLEGRATAGARTAYGPSSVAGFADVLPVGVARRHLDDAGRQLGSGAGDHRGFGHRGFGHRFAPFGGLLIANVLTLAFGVSGSAHHVLLQLPLGAGWNNLTITRERSQ